MTNNTGNTKLTKDQQKAVLFWPNVQHMPIIDCQTYPKKVVSKDKWPKLDLDNVDYEKNLLDGLYDHGIAVRLGRTLPINGNQNDRLYSIAIDFDRPEGIRAWFGNANTWDHVVDASKKTRIEWHGSKDRIHYFFKAKRPVTNLRISGLGIEVRCENNLLFVSPSIHPDGNEYTALGTEEIVVLDELQLTRLECLINSLSANYTSDENKQAYIGWLEDPNTKLVEGQGRHPALVVLGTSYFYRFNGEWRGLTDDQRREKLFDWNLDHCDPPKPEKEFNQIWAWILKYHRKSRDKLHEELEDKARARSEAVNDNNNGTTAEYGDDVAKELDGNVFYKINEKPAKFIIAYKQTKKLIETKLHIKDVERQVNGQTEKIQLKYLVHNRTFLTCIPTKITRHKNPLAFLENNTKYSISFVDAAGEHTTFKHKTLAEILAGLRDKGYVLTEGAEGAIGSMVQAYKERGIMENNSDIEYTGFFLSATDDGGTGGIGEVERKPRIITASNVDIKTVSINDLADSLNTLSELAKYYSGRLDLLATSIVWGLVAPIDFVLKTNDGSFLKWLHFWGFTNATKSSTGTIILAIDGHHNDPKFTLNISNMDTIARLGEAISKTTFPKLVDEVDLNENLRYMINQLKSAIESKILRTKFTKDGTTPMSIPALSVLVMTSNPPPPYYDSAYMRRIIERTFPQSESYKPDDPIAAEFREFLKMNLDRLKSLGDFRNWFVLNNQNVVLDKKTTPIELGRKILTAAYDHAEIKKPEWLDTLLPENQLEESLADNDIIVKRAFEAYITSNYDRNITTWRFEKMEGIVLSKATTDRLAELVDNNKLPDIKRYRKYETDEKGNQTKPLIIYKGILGELYKQGVSRDQLPSLKALSDYMGGRY